VTDDLNSIICSIPTPVQTGSGSKGLISGLKNDISHPLEWSDFNIETQELNKILLYFKGLCEIKGR
jgi:hypothetical protein